MDPAFYGVCLAKLATTLAEKEKLAMNKRGKCTDIQLTTPQAESL